MHYIVERLKEPSTWRGLGWIVTSVIGVSISTEQWQLITDAGMALVGLIGVFSLDNK